MRGDGDGWVACALGHRHWGRFGAAGLLLREQQRCVLQHRAPWTHHGDSWGLPGGAMDGDESPIEAALREASEEAGIEPDSVRPLVTVTIDHGGWSYTTVIAEPRSSTVAITPRAANAESLDVRWWDDDAVAGLPLHPGFGHTWEVVRGIPRGLTLRLDSVAITAAELDHLARHGLDMTALAALGRTDFELPSEFAAGRVFPRVSYAGVDVTDPSALVLTDALLGLLRS